MTERLDKSALESNLANYFKYCGFAEVGVARVDGTIIKPHDIIDNFAKVRGISQDEALADILRFNSVHVGKEEAVKIVGMWTNLYGGNPHQILIKLMQGD